MINRKTSDGYFTISLEPEGRLTLPISVQQQLGLQPGDRLTLQVQNDGSLRLVSLREQLKQVRGILKSLAPERNLTDELIQDRREEAACE
ncbi:AbrB/MazE/SpoVT family DNA-binding domain-containing protein [Pleurocapsales cyanobacterium LEGE 06147]|nr:AbrB/MazE/SpoVT family DNA-binding domain-containing protein [Pleurocapsales cyanobacterium LEGE 06147]